MREVTADQITDTVAELCIRANRILGDDLKCSLKRAEQAERNGLPKEILGDLVRNYELAEELHIPVCQDTGLAVVFVEIGQDLHITGGDFGEAVNRGVAKGYTEGLLRLSVVEDPLRRRNTGDNTPAVLHTSIVPGDRLSITVAPKGAGSENMSAIRMMNPSATREDIIAFVADTVRTAGSNPCPPVVVGVGIGGNFEACALLAKRALCRSLDEAHPDPFYRELEEEMLARVNALDIGPQGFGGDVTALAVHIGAAPTHIASLPVAVNMGCHVTRHATAVL
ncbi:MAG: fumarate hydratase [Oscillospiraceae bacterium]